MDTSTILSGLAVPVILLLFAAWREIRDVRHENKTLLAKVAEIEKRFDADTRKFADSSTKKDEEIERQKKEIIDLHKRLNDRGFKLEVI